MYLNTNDPKECFGCTACENICPKKCIQMIESNDGFLYPQIDYEKCIHCKMCESVCPIDSKVDKSQKDICFYGWHKDSKIRASSTSGAAFIALSQVCRDIGYKYFYGAAYDNQMNVHHIEVGFEDIEQLRCSKYVQSNLNRVYKDIKEKLLRSEKVLFSGTPCQVDGLLKYLHGIDVKNLFTIALVCHGVSSPKVFKKYITELEKSNKAKVQKIRFRDKRAVNGLLSHKYTTLKMTNGKIFSTTNNIYTTAFGIGIMDRESCYHCPYTSPTGAGDITIGDFWGIEKEVKNIENEISKGISLLIPHSIKAESIINMLDNYMILNRVPLKYAVNDRQRQLSVPIERPKSRNKFLENVLGKDKSFTKEAKRAILIWKIQNYKQRILKKISKVFR